MTKAQAQAEWTSIVHTTAEAWLEEFGDASLDAEWTETAFADIDGDVIEALRLADPWVRFHRDVQDAIEDLCEPGDSTRL